MATQPIEIAPGNAMVLIQELQGQLAELKNERAASVISTNLFQPKNMSEAWDLAKIIADSDFAPKDYRGKPGNCIIAMQYGADLNIPVLQAIQNISVVNGRPSIWGHLYWALVTNHRDFVDAEEEITNKGAKITLTRRGRKPVFREFTEAMAIKAGLLNKDSPWKTYPEAMYMWRVRHNAGDALFPEATRGIIPREIVYDYPTIEGVIDQGLAASTKTEAAETTVVKITQDQAREFAKAWKASGFSIADAKANLKEICGVESSLDIPGDKYEAAMRWATKNPHWPDTAPTQDEAICRELFSILGYDLAKQAEAIDAAKGDWNRLAKKLNAELPVE